MSTPREIAFEDIRKGDDIEVVWERDDRTDTSRGIADHKDADGWWRTRGGQLLAGPLPAANRTILLHHRPAPAEPEGLGAVVRARTRSGSREGQFVHIRAELGAERWQGPGGGIYYWSDFDPDSIEVLSEGIEVES